MAAPPVSPPAQEFYEALAPTFTVGDEDRGYPLLKLCNALCPSPIRQIHSYVTDQEDGTPGWVIVFDPDNAPVEVLPYLAQFDGAEIRPDMDEAQIRDAIRSPQGFGRGRPSALAKIAQRHLTGGKTVLLDERSDGTVGVDKPWQMRIRTLASETPDPELTEREIRAEWKPIGIVLTYLAIDGQTWGDLRLDHATWADVQADYATWEEVRTDLP